MLIVAFLMFLVVIWIKVPGLVREKMWGELIAFAGILAVAMVLTVAKIIRLPVPNPEHALRAVFEPVTDFIFTKVLH